MRIILYDEGTETAKVLESDLAEWLRKLAFEGGGSAISVALSILGDVKTDDEEAHVAVH